MTALAAKQQPMIPAAIGGIAEYLRTVRRVPMLSAEEERRLALAYRRDNDLAAARQLIMPHLRLVAAVARGYDGYGLPQADLIQEGNIGLMKAVKRFDPERGARLATFAVYWIKAEIHEFVIRNWRIVKIATTKAQRKLFFNLRRMMGSSQPSDDSTSYSGDYLDKREASRIARELGVKTAEVFEMHRRMKGEIPFDAAVGESEENAPLNPLQYLQSEEGRDAEQILMESHEKTAAREALAEAMDSLDERSRTIIRARWLGESGGKTLHNLADELGVSAERVRQIEKRAMEKIRGLVAHRLAA